jgi:hypothetical protein
MSSDALTTAIQTYFAGERHEGFAILAFSAGLALVAAAMHVAARDGFSRGFGAVALLLAVLLSSTVISLIRRDTPHQVELTAEVRGGDAGAALAAEASRVAEVIRRYPYYRVVALGLGLLALVAVAVSRRGWVNGAAAGVLLAVVAQVAIDHHSEARAMRYAGDLRAAHAERAAP